MQMFCVPSAHLNMAYQHSLMGIQAATEHNIACIQGGITSKELQVLTNVKSTQIATHELMSRSTEPCQYHQSLLHIGQAE